MGHSLTILEIALFHVIIALFDVIIALLQQPCGLLLGVLARHGVCQVFERFAGQAKDSFSRERLRLKTEKSNGRRSDERPLE